MKMWFLGTGAGRPAKHRNVSAIALQLPEPRGWWLFDAGEATQHSLLHLPLKLSRLEAIFITHLHGDHLFGLPGLLGSRSFDGGTSPLKIYGPKGLKSYVETTFAISGTHVEYELTIIELEEDGGLDAFYRDDLLQVDARLLHHRVPCFGYRVTENDRPGRLMAEKLKDRGLESGPAFGKLKRGESVELPDGSIVKPEDFTDGMVPGRVVTILGDTSPCSAVGELARNADLLVHEATFAAGLEEKAHEFGHSTTTEAAKAALAAGAAKLAMTHFSGRYGNEELSQLEEEAKSVFPSVFAATDGSCVDIPRRSTVRDEMQGK
ncbi:ribonuclease Z [Paenibacillus sp. CAU 1782]